jgi:DNA-directed RNA polymerase subunit beta
MPRQAVPILSSEAPIVGTGIEQRVASDSGACVVAKRDGVVDSVDATRIVVRAEAETGALPDIYRLTKFQRSNQNTCYNQKPVVRAGEMVKAGDVLADGPAIERGELALGKNVVVAFMSWGGYNFEDSILLSERLIKEDVFTSVHIEEFECIARDTKLGKEEITRDIPNVGEEALKDIDDSGIIRIGAEVGPGDILVGKITPKGETQLTPEEKLLRAIFGEKAGDVRDSSLRVPPGVAGIIIGAQVFARKGAERDERTREIENYERSKYEKDMADEQKILRDAAYDRIANALVGKKTESKLVDDLGKELLEKGCVIDKEVLRRVPRKYWGAIDAGDSSEQSKAILDDLNQKLAAVEELFQEKIGKLSKGDELPPGVIRMVKVYIAIKRKLQVGDKMAGRHGNKGVVSRILPIEDMPYLEDGTPVDIVLNPLGVPSRMNVGQVLEVHLGWAGYLLGKQIQAYMNEQELSLEALRAKVSEHFTMESTKTLIEELDEENLKKFMLAFKDGIRLATPVFDGANEGQIKSMLQSADVSTNGKCVAFDGRSGLPFDQDVTVGVMYMMKLHHLVDDKIHARSIGPYSLVTQQPLGGKAQFGGQRLGEMEVWAMEAYGAAFALQEFLTVKSDDVQGRTRMYEAIVKGDQTLEAGLPESFNVLMKELQALCLNVELIDTRGSFKRKSDDVLASQEE